MFLIRRVWQILETISQTEWGGKNPNITWYITSDVLTLLHHKKFILLKILIYYDDKLSLANIKNGVPQDSTLEPLPLFVFFRYF